MTIALSSECRIVYLPSGGLRTDPALSAALAEPVDWDRVLALAVANKAAGALDTALTRLGGAAVPAAAREQLRRQRMVGEFHSHYLRERLLETLSALRSGNVNVMLLKGAALGSTVYESPTERPMADIDLLIRGSDREAVGAALAAVEWRAEQNPALVRLYTEHHHLPPFYDSRRSGHRIEVHVAPFPPPNPFGAADREMWERAVPAPAKFSGALVPSLEHMVVYACVHFAWSHMLTGGAWRTCRDLAVLSESGVDWNEVLAVARRWKAASACYWTLRLASTLSGAVLAPATVVEAMRPPLPSAVAAALERHFVAQLVAGERVRCPSIRLAEWLWRIAMRPRWSGHGRRIRENGGKRWDAPPSHETVPQPETIRVQKFGDWRRYLTALGSDRRPALPR